MAHNDAAMPPRCFLPFYSFSFYNTPPPFLLFFFLQRHPFLLFYLFTLLPL